MIVINKLGLLNKKFFLILLLVIFTACSESINEKELLDRAKNYIEKDNFNSASLELKNILRNNAKNAEARYLLGKISLDLGDIKTAEKEFKRARDTGWDEALINLSFAKIFLRQGNFQKLLDDIPIKDHYPNTVKADLMGLWAASEAGLGKWDEAEQLINDGKEINGDALWLLHTQIRLEVQKKNQEAAMQVLEHALKMHPDSQDLWLLSARLANEANDNKTTTESLEKVIELDPVKNITVWGRQARIDLTKIWLKQQDYKKALTVIKPLRKIYPDDPVANYFRALIAFSQGDYDLTEERLLSVFKVAPQHQQSQLLFGILNYARKDYQQAIYYLEKITASQPNNIEAQTLLGKAHLMLGQYDEAGTRLELASTKLDDNAELLALVGLSRLSEGDIEAGIQQLEKAAAAAPTDSAIHNELARAYINTGETKQAIKELESTLDMEDPQHRTEALLLRAYLQDGEFNKALNVATRLSQQMTNSPLPHNYAGTVHEAMQDFPSATASYQAALAIDPKNSMALIGLARLDLHANKTSSARNRFEMILKEDENNPQALTGLAKIIGQEGKIDEAIQLVEKARVKNPKALQPRLFLAEYYLQKNDADKALIIAQEASKITLRNSRVLALLGRAQLGTRQGKKSLATFHTLVELEPDWAIAHYHLSQAQAYDNDLVNSQKSLELVLRLDATYSPAKLALGRLKLLANKTEEALKLARELQKSKDSEASGYLLEGDILMLAKKPAQASHAYQKSFDLAPENNKVVIKLYKSIISAGNTEDAFLILEKWLDTHPQDATIREVLAIAYQTHGKAGHAAAEYEKIIKQYPDKSTVLNNLAWLYFEEKNEKKHALELAKKAHQLSPDNAAIMDTYGWILLETGSLEQGIRLLHKAAEALANNSVHYHLAVALARTGDKAAAINKLKTILKNGEKFPEIKKAKALLQELT